MTPTSPEPPEGIRTVGSSASQTRSTRLVLIRHGESSCSLSGVVGGPKGCTGLSKRGVKEAEALRDRLVESKELADAGALYTSMLARAYETALIAAPGIGAGLEIVRDCALCELHPGEGDGLGWEEFVSKYGEPDFDVDPSVELSPGGESWTSFVGRASRALAELVERHRGELIVVVCHAGVIEASILEFLPVDRRRTRLKLRTENASLTEWERGEDGFRLVRYNDTSHLGELKRS